MSLGPTGSRTHGPSQTSPTHSHVHICLADPSGDSGDPWASQEAERHLDWVHQLCLRYKTTDPTTQLQSRSPVYCQRCLGTNNTFEKEFDQVLIGPNQLPCGGKQFVTMCALKFPKSVTAKKNLWPHNPQLKNKKYCANNVKGAHWYFRHMFKDLCQTIWLSDFVMPWKEASYIFQLPWEGGSGILTVHANDVDCKGDKCTWSLNS